MMNNLTLEKLQRLRLAGMARAFEEQLTMPDVARLAFDERLGLLVDREETERNGRRYANRLRKARLREVACLEDCDFSPKRGVDKSVLLALASCEWIRQGQHVLITGSTGVGKTWLACALSQRACRDGFTVRYSRAHRLLHNLAVARADGSYTELMASLVKVDVLVLDDWGLSTLTPDERANFLELVEDRHGFRSLVITSQVPTEKWFDVIGDPTLGDSILDRIIHRSHRLDLKGPSKRRETSALTKKTTMA